MGTEIDSLEIKITSEAGTAEKAINSLIKCLGNLSTSLKFDTSSLEKLGNINGNNFKKLGEGLQSFANAAKSLQNVNSGNFNKLANGIDKIASIDPSKLEALGKIDGNSFRGLGEGVKALSSGLQNLQWVKKSDFNRLATGIERLAAIQPGNMETVGNALRPLAEGINILSNAKFDNKNLTNLINSLTRLSNANTGSLANIDFTALGNSIKGLADTLSGAEKVQQNTISMTNAIAKLASAGENANIVSAALPQLGEKLKAFMQTMTGAPQLESDTIAFTQALAQLANAGKRAESTASGLPKLGESLKNIFDTMSKMPSISENTIRMTQALAQFANAGGKAGNAAGNLNGRINTLSSSMLGLRGSTLKAVGGLKNFARQLLSSMGIYLGIYGAIRGAKKAIDISSQLTEVQNVVDVTFGDMAYKVEEFAQTSIEQFGLSELALKQYSSRFQAMGSAMVIDSSLIGSANENLSKMADGYISASDSMSDMSLNLTKLTADMASFYNVEQDIVAEKLASIFTGQTRPLRDFGLDLTQATLQEWALKQGMDVNIQSMSQAEKTMLRYQYVLANTTAAHGDFERTMYTWANQVRILKQNFEQLASVIGGALVNAFKPVVIAINKAMSAIIAFAKTISNSLGQIFGWTFEEGGGGLAQDFGGAADAADDMAGSLGDAGKAIDKMKAGLRAFDELKVINLPDDKDGGAGAGGAGGLGGALGGQWIQGESILKKYESELDTLYKLGEYIGNKLAEAMNSIDWDSVYEKAQNFGKGLADFLNGLISPDLFGAVGRTIAGSLNTALEFLNTFGKTFDWEDFGLSIATGINEFFKTFKFDKLADTINTWIKGALKTATTMLKKTDFKMIGEKIGKFLAELDWIGYVKETGKFIWEAIKAALATWKSAFDAAPIETGILTAVSVLKFTKLGDVLTGKINGALSKVKDGLSLQGIATAIAGVFGEFTMISDAFEGLTSGAQGVGSALMEIVAGAGLAVGALKLIGLSNPWTAVIVGITGVIGALKGMADAQQEALEKFAEEQEISVFGEKVSDMTKRIDESVQSIRNRIDASMEYVQTAGIGEMQMAQELADRYFELSEKENLSNTEMDEMQRLAGLLLEKVPELNQFYNEQTGLLETNKQAVDELIDSRLKEIQLNAAEEQLTEAYKRRYDTLLDLKEISEQLQKGQEELTQLQNKYEDAVSRRDAAIAYEEIGKLLSLGAESLDGLNVSQELLNQLASAGVDTTGDLKDTYEQLWDVAAQGEDQIPHWSELNEAIDEADFALESFGDSYQEVLNNFTNMKSAYNATESNIEDLSKLVKDGMIDVGNDFDIGFEQGILEEIKKVEEAAGLVGKATERGARKKIKSHSPSLVAKKIGKDFVDGYNLGITENAESTKSATSSWISSISGLLTSWLSSTQSSFTQSWNSINVTNNTTWNTMKNTIANAGNAIRSNVSQSTTNVRTNVLNAWNVIKSNTTSSWNTNRTQISNSWNSIRANTISTTNTMKSNISTSWNNVKSVTSITWNSMKNMTNAAWNNIKVNVSSSTGSIRSTIQNEMGRAESGWASAWNSMLGKTNGILGSIQGAVSSAMNSISGMISAINGALDSLFAKAASASNISVSKGGSSGGSGKKNTKTASPRMASPEISTAAFQGVNIPAFAGGGITLKHTFAEIGEYNRPEAILPLTNAKAMGMIAESIYENYSGNSADSGFSSDVIERAVYTATYNAVSAAINNSSAMREQNRILEGILEKPTLSNNDVFDAARSVYKGEATRRYGDSTAFDPIWG